MEKSIFTKIIDRQIPASIIYEDESVIVIPDKFPSMKGQLLVIPKQQSPYIFDLDDETYTHLMLITKKIAKALDRALGATRTCIVVEGFEVPHVHVRLYPTDDRLILSPRKEASDEELHKLADTITKAL